MARPKPDDIKPLVQNRKARHEYHIEETLEAGIVLLGSEVKSLRDGRGNFADAHAELRGGELWLADMHISPYSFANQFNHDPLRRRKLLVHRAELRRIAGKVERRGYALIPLRAYLKDGRVKVEIALARGKQLHDKRHAAREATARREAEAAMRRER